MDIGDGVVQSGAMVGSRLANLGKSCCAVVDFLTDPEALEQAITGFKPPIR